MRPCARLTKHSPAPHIHIQLRARARVFLSKTPFTPKTDLKTATLTPSSSKPFENYSPPTNPGHHHKKPKSKATHKRSQANKRIDFLLKQKFDDDPDFRPLLVGLAELDPTHKKKYLAWLVKHWLGDWKATEEEKRRVAGHLATHHQGTKYFSPLGWTGLLLEDVGYNSDIFQCTPESLVTLGGRITEIIRIAEEDKQLRQREPVALAGPEIVHQDNEFTIIRVRTTGALIRISQGSSWCISSGNLLRRPFDRPAILIRPLLSPVGIHRNFLDGTPLSFKT